jgi:hypothetical protein
VLLLLFTHTVTSRIVGISPTGMHLSTLGSQRLGEADAVGRAKLQNLSGDVAVSTSLFRRRGGADERVELRSRPRRAERLGFEVLSGAGTAIYSGGRRENAATRAARAELKAPPAGCPAGEPGGEAEEQSVDDSADDIRHSTESRVGSRVPH